MSEGKGVGLILPTCDSEAMNLHHAEIGLSVAPAANAVLLVDRLCRLGSHHSMLPKCPEFNSVENVWQFMRDNRPSNRVFKAYDDLVEHCSVRPGTSPSTSLGASCPLDCASGRTGRTYRGKAHGLMRV